jgi:hypothetical protein
MIMTPKQAWETIINQLNDIPIEFHTTPLINKKHLWFSATTDGDKIYIDNSLENIPSSKISSPRKLTFKTFQKVYPFYLRREKGEQVSKAVSKITLDSVYFYSLLRFLCN